MGRRISLPYFASLHTGYGLRATVLLLIRRKELLTDGVEMRPLVVIQ